MGLFTKVKSFFLNKILVLFGGKKVKKLLESIKGKKTYIVAFIGAGIALAEAYGYKFPEWVYVLLGSIGLGTLRAGINKP